MSENPYQAPEAQLSEQRSVGPAGDFSIGECFSQAWAATWSSVGVWLPASIVGFLIVLIAAITIIGYFVVVPVMMWGFAVLLLNMIDNKADFGDIFSGFSNYWRVLGRTLLLLLIFIGINLAANSLAYVGMLIDSPQLQAAGQLVGGVLYVIIILRLYLAIFFMVDRDLPTMEALSASWNALRGKGWRMFLLMLLSIPVVLAGLLVLIVGVIPASVIVYGLFASAYRQMVPAN